MSVITVSNLCISYDAVKAVENLNFSVELGDYLCVVGENGSGKSTLIKTLLGLQKPSCGNIYFDGISSAQIGYMPQQTNIQRDFPASVEEVVLTGCIKANGINPFFSRKTKDLARKNLALVDADSLSKKCYGELSGGQQQRVLLARALCSTEKLLLLDEPAASLDPKATNELYSLIKSLNRDSGITIIMISHDVTSAVSQSNKILHLEKSALFFGKTEDYIESNAGKLFLSGENDA